MSNAVNFMRSIVCLVVFAPFYLINEISLKVVFLKKEVISQILLVSVLVDAATAAGIIIFKLLAGTFSVLYGPLPLIVMAFSIAVLLLLYMLFNTVSFMIFDDLRHMFPAEPAGNSQEDEEEESFGDGGGALPPADVEDGYTDGPEQFTDDLVQLALDSLQEQAPASGQDAGASTDISIKELNKLIDGISMEGINGLEEGTNGLEEAAGQDDDLVSQLAALSAQTMADSTTGVSFDGLISKFDSMGGGNAAGEAGSSVGMYSCVRSMGAKADVLKSVQRHTEFTGRELEDLHSRMDASVDPSKFLDEGFIQNFTSSRISGDIGFLDGLNISVLPADFGMLS